MITLTDRVQITATGVHFENENLVVAMSDGRELILPLRRYKWLNWLAHATPQQRAQWSLEPGGFAVYWENLDDGIEIEHLLSLDTLG